MTPLMLAQATARVLTQVPLPGLSAASLTVLVQEHTGSRPDGRRLRAVLRRWIGGAQIAEVA